MGTGEIYDEGWITSDHAYTVRIDGDRVLVGTHDGLAVYEKGQNGRLIRPKMD